jgi:flagellum-specific peptidoglycan hydrolase FlgJ
MTGNQEQRLREIAAIAVRIEDEMGLPAQMLIAQWAIESQWGARPAGQANYFGIKAADRHKLCCTVATREVIGGNPVRQTLQFADYDSLDASCRDYAWLITQGAPYRQAWLDFQQAGGVASLARKIAGVYATDPGYARLLERIASQANVLDAIAQARGAA